MIIQVLIYRPDFPKVIFIDKTFISKDGLDYGSLLREFCIYYDD